MNRYSKNKLDPALVRHLRRALPVAQEAAIQAGDFLKKKFGKLKNIQTKPDASLVSEADRGAEKIILRVIKKHFPYDQFTAEESGKTGSQKRSSLFRWHIDPLDGTTNFIHGFPLFCVSIGLEFEQDNLILGVIQQPMTNQLYTATQGAGAYCNGKKISVSKVKSISDSLLSTGFSYKRSQFHETEIECFSKISSICRATRRTGSAALDLTFVACGQFDGFWEQGLNSWDIAAGIVLIQEAGGEVSDFTGGPLSLSSPCILGTNGLIHSEMIKNFKSK